MSTYRRVARKPGDEENTYILLASDGRLRAVGDVTDPEIDLEWNAGSWRDVARDLVVTDWTTPSGYILSGWGTVHAFGSATQGPTGVDPGAPTSTQGVDLFRAILMDPTATGAGYRLRADGLVERFGSVLPPDIGTGPGANAIDAGGAIAMVGNMADFATGMEFYVLDVFGKVWPCNGAPTPDNYGQWFSGTIPSDGFNFCRDIDVADWSDMAGYVVDGYGRVFSFGEGGGAGAKRPASKPNWRAQGWDVVRDIHIVAYSPFEYWITTNAGQSHHVFVTDAPEVTVTEPSATETGTKTPTIVWSYDDNDDDKPEKYEIYIYTAGQVAAGDFEAFVSEPTTSKIIYDYKVMQWTVEEELDNDTYTAYVRAYEPNSDAVGDADSITWLQNVTLGTAPTAVISQVTGELTNEIVVTETTAYVTPVVSVESYHGEDRQWYDVMRGVRTSFSGGTATVYDYEVKAGSQATYRIRVYDSDDDEASYTEYLQEIATAIDDDNTWIITPKYPNSAKAIRIKDERRFHEVAGAVFKPLGQKKAIAIHQDNKVQGFAGQITIQTLNDDEWTDLWNLLSWDDTVLLRDQFGRRMYFTIEAGLGEDLLKAAPLPYETTSVRKAHEWTFSYVEVERPS